MDSKNDKPDFAPLEEIEPEKVASGSMFFEDESMLLTSSKLSALENFLSLLTKDLKFSDFMRELLLVYMRLIKCEAGSVLEYDHPNERYFFRAIVGQSSDKLDGFTVPKGQGIVGHVGESKQPLVVNDIEENKQHLKAIGQAVGFETRNLVAFPILIRGKIFCVVELLNRIGEDDFTPVDTDVLVEVSNHAAKIIEIKLMINWATRLMAERKGGRAA